MTGAAVVDVLKTSWKSLLAFGVLFLTNVATQLTTVGVPWPVDGGQWTRFLLTTALGTYIVWQGPSNKKRTRRRRPAKKAATLPIGHAEGP